MCGTGNKGHSLTALASLLIDSKEMGSGTHFSHALGISGDYRLTFISASCLLSKNPRKAAARCLLSITLVILSIPSSWNHRKKNCGVTLLLLSGNQSSADEPSVLWSYHSPDLPVLTQTTHPGVFTHFLLPVMSVAISTGQSIPSSRIPAAVFTHTFPPTLHAHYPWHFH